MTEVYSEGLLEDKKPLHQDWEQWSGNWIWRATQCLVESPDFNPSPKWIAGRLGVSIEKALEALEGLERLGCIKRVGATFKVVQGWFQNTPELTSKEKLLLAHSKVAPQLMSKLTSEDAFTTQFFLGNQELIKKYAPRFIQLFKEMNEEAIKMGHKDVIASEMSFTQLTMASESMGDFQ